MDSMKHFLLCVPLLAGCANMDQGFGIMERGLAVLDVGSDQVIEAYVQAAKALRSHCGDDLQCQQKYGVTDEDITEVMDAATQLAMGYDHTAVGLAMMREAWGRIGPKMKKTIKAAKDLEGITGISAGLD